MKKRTSNRSFAAISIILILFLSFSHVSATQWNVGTGKNFTNIQEAVDNSSVADGDVINVFNGTYKEDIVVHKNLTIKVNNKDIVILKPINTGFTVVNDATGNGGGTSITGFIIKLSTKGLGFNITANDVKIENNNITGGKNGIIITGNHTTIQKNIISNVLNTSINAGQLSSGNNSTLVDKFSNDVLIYDNIISGGQTGINVYGDSTNIARNIISNVLNSGIFFLGGNPTIIGNIVRDMVGSESKAGIVGESIKLSGTTGLTLMGNIISNIHSTNGGVTGISAFTMTMDSSIRNILVSGNTISDLYGVGSSLAMYVGTMALQGDVYSLKVMNNTIKKVVSTGVNSTSTAISCVPMGFASNNYTNNSTNNNTKSKTLMLSQNDISEILAEGENSTTKGISFTMLVQGNPFISENKISKIEADKLAVGLSSMGVDYTTFQSNITIDQNNITDIHANDEVDGIQSVNIGNTYILHNNIFRLDGANTTYIEQLSPNNFISKIIPFIKLPPFGAVIIGNNLEGNGKDIGIGVFGNNTTINYNRIANFQYYIKNMELMDYAKSYNYSDQDIRNYLKSLNYTKKQIEEAIVIYHSIMDKINNIPSYTDAPYNWYGTNNPQSSNFLPRNGTLNYQPWLILSINADPSTIHVGQTSNITADVYQDSGGGDHRADAAQYFSGPQLIFTTNLGNIGSKSITVDWVNGLATAILRADEGPGIATVTATDYQTVQAFVTILGAPKPPTPVNPVIDMQDTGTPISYIVMALVLLISGLGLSKKR